MNIIDFKIHLLKVKIADHFKKMKVSNL
jgi:hypothetical protein